MSKHKDEKKWFDKVKLLAVSEYGKTEAEVEMWQFPGIWWHYFSQGYSPRSTLENEMRNEDD